MTDVSSDNFNVWDESIEDGPSSLTTASVVALQDTYVFVRLSPGAAVHWGTGGDGFEHYTPSFDEGVASLLEQTKRLSDHVDDAYIGDEVVCAFAHNGRAHFVTAASNTCTVIVYDPAWPTLGKWSFVPGMSLAANDLQWALYGGTLHYIQSEPDFGDYVRVGSVEVPDTAQLYDSEDAAVNVTPTTNVILRTYAVPQQQGDMVENVSLRQDLGYPFWRFNANREAWVHWVFRVWDYTGPWDYHDVMSTEIQVASTSGWSRFFTNMTTWWTSSPPESQWYDGEPAPMVDSDHYFPLVASEETLYYSFEADRWAFWRYRNDGSSSKPSLTEVASFPYPDGVTVVPTSAPDSQGVDFDSSTAAIVGPVVEDAGGQLQLLVLRAAYATDWADDGYFPIGTAIEDLIYGYGPYDPEEEGLTSELRVVTLALDDPPLYHDLRASAVPNAKLLAHVWHPTGYLLVDGADEVTLEALVSLDAENPRDDELSVPHMASVYASLGTLLLDPPGVDPDPDPDPGGGGDDLNVLLTLDFDTVVGTWAGIEGFDNFGDLDLSFDAVFDSWVLLFADFDVQWEFDTVADATVTVGGFDNFGDLDLRIDTFLSGVVSLVEDTEFTVLSFDFDTALSLGDLLLLTDTDVVLDFDLLLSGEVAGESNYTDEFVCPVPGVLSLSASVDVTKIGVPPVGVPPSPDGYVVDTSEETVARFLWGEGDMLGRVDVGPNVFITADGVVKVTFGHESPTDDTGMRLVRLFGHVYTDPISFDDAVLIAEAGYGGFLLPVS